MQVNSEAWWERGNPAYDAERTQCLLSAMHRLLKRDANLLKRPVRLVTRYPGNVDLDVFVSGAVDADGSDDWFFTLTGPGFRVVLMQYVEPGSGAVGGEDLDGVEGEALALAWLADPPQRLGSNEAEGPVLKAGASIPQQLFAAVTQLVPDIASMTLNDEVLLDRPLLDRTGLPFTIDIDPGLVNAEPFEDMRPDTENTRTVALWQWSHDEFPDAALAGQRVRGFVIRLDFPRRRANAMTFAQGGDEFPVPAAARDAKNLLTLEWLLDLLARGPRLLSQEAAASDDAH